jgi:hypothetical protein
MKIAYAKNLYLNLLDRVLCHGLSLDLLKISNERSPQHCYNFDPTSLVLVFKTISSGPSVGPPVPSYVFFMSNELSA